MNKLWLGIATLVVAAVISAVAAYFSIVGLVALFAASAIPVAIMGISLEVGKLWASGILKVNWTNKNYSKALKGYLLASVGTLMLVTSIGIYGFLSAGHLEQAAPRADLQVQTQQLELQVQQKNDENQRLTQRLGQIDQNVGAFLQNDQARQGLRASQTLQRERTQIQERIEANNQQINQLQTQLAPLRIQNNQVEAKLGPVKYVAALLGWEDEESAVRLVILILMIGFDPLAIVLMLCGLIMLKEHREEKDTTTAKVVDAAYNPLRMEDDYEFCGSEEWQTHGRSWADAQKAKRDAEEEIAVEESSGCVWNDIAMPCQKQECDICDPDLKDRIEREMLDDYERYRMAQNETPEPEFEDRSDYDRAQMGDEIAHDYPDEEPAPAPVQGAVSGQIGFVRYYRPEEMSYDFNVDENGRAVYGDTPDSYPVTFKELEERYPGWNGENVYEDEVVHVEVNPTETLIFKTPVGDVSVNPEEISPEVIDQAKTAFTHKTQYAAPSYNHAICEIDGLQAALNEEAPVAEGDEPPVEEIVREMDRDTLIDILERNPGILNEIEAIVEEDVVEEMTDREKLLDLLSKNPAIISDMAEIMAAQIASATRTPDKA